MLNLQTAFELVNQVFQTANPDKKVPLGWYDSVSHNGGFAFEVDVRGYLANGGDIDRLAARSGRIQHNISTFLHGHYEVRVLNSVGLAVVIKPKIVSERVDVLATLTSDKKGAVGAIVVGMPGWGKTTMLQHIAQTHVQAGAEVVVVDALGSPSRWPGMRRIGANYTYDAVLDEVDRALRVMIQRNDEISSGRAEECSHDPWYLVVDEFPGLVEADWDTAQKIHRIVREGRKARMGAYLGSHTDSVTHLGLEGKGGFRNAFYFVYLSVDSARTHQVQMTLGYKTQPMAGTIPGEFRPLLSREPEPKALPEPVQQGLVEFKGGTAKPYAISIGQQQLLLALCLAFNEGFFSVAKAAALASQLKATQELKYAHIYELYKSYVDRALIEPSPGGNVGAKITNELKQLAGISDEVIIGLQRKLKV